MCRKELKAVQKFTTQETVPPGVRSLAGKQETRMHDTWHQVVQHGAVALHTYKNIMPLLSYTAHSKR